MAGLVLAGALSPGSAYAAAAATPYDFNGDGYADLAVGVPGESLGDVESAGAVQVLYGGSGGLTARGDEFWTQDSAGVGRRADLPRCAGVDAGLAGGQERGPRG